jgi:MiaB/RimO family radical SAM methylthiotransferase
MNPTHIKPILEKLVEVYKHPKVYRFIHIPVQSGSDRILRKMRRGYKTREFVRIVEEFRKLPNVTLSTDIIVGFPGESEEDFNKTLELVKRIKPDIVNVSKFGVRPKTEASRMKQLDNKIVKERSKKLADLVRKIGLEKNKEWVSKECEILITERGKRRNQFVGRNESYKPVIVEGKNNLMGRFLKVRISDFDFTHMDAEITRNSV